MNQTPISTWIKQNLETSKQFPRNADVWEPGFDVLYVRLGNRWIGEWEHCLQVARIQAKRPGRGCFKALVRRLQTEFPQLPIYVENVLSLRFRRGLLRMGFVEVPGQSNSHSPSYILKQGKGK